MCPRCVRLEVTPGPLERMRLGLWKKVLVTAGARAYRCNFCGYKFLSFKRAQSALPPASSPAEPTDPGEARRMVDNPQEARPLKA